MNGNSTKIDRGQLQPRLIDLIAGLRRHQVEEAMQLLLDYIDDARGGSVEFLTQSIQGLSGNVANLVEERAPVRVSAEDSRWSGEEISSMSRNPVPPYEFNRVPEIPKEWFKTVKRGPATDHELAALWNWSGHHNSPDPNNKLRDVVNAILKSRGLID